MTISTLYTELNNILGNNTLKIDMKFLNSVYSDILFALNTDEITINHCNITKNDDFIQIDGIVSSIINNWKNAKISIFTAQKDQENVYSKIKLELTGDFLLTDLFGELAPYKDNSFELKESLFCDIAIINPVFQSDYGTQALNIDAFAYKPVSGFWDNCYLFDNNIMCIKGRYISSFNDYPDLKIEFFTSNSVKLTIGSASTGKLVINTVYRNFEMYSVYYIEYDIYMSALNKTLSFDMYLIDDNRYQFSSITHISVNDITYFLKNIFNLNNYIPLPDEMLLSTFSLNNLDIIYTKDDNFSKIKHIRAAFKLDKPLQFFIPNISLNNFYALWESSCWSVSEPVTSLYLQAEFNFKLGSFLLNGTINAYYPFMDFKGRFELSKEVTLKELATDCNTNLPDFWSGNNKILSGDVLINSNEKNYSLCLQVSDILSLKINDNLSFKIDNIYTNISHANGQNLFTISGYLSFKYGKNDYFSFFLESNYSDNDWIFTGGLSSGSVKLGAFISSVLGVTVSDKQAIDIVLDGFLATYSTKNQELLLYASCNVWFDILGIRTTLGGRVRLRQVNDIKQASLSAYVDIDKLKLRVLAQIDDIYLENKKYTFRLEFLNSYLQAIYNDNKLIITLGGFSFGDIINSLIHLLNPNLKVSLSAPWNIINKINLSKFVLIIDLETNYISLIYNANFTIAGIMKINQIGFEYDSQKIEYILTGKFLGLDFTLDNPFKWDAIDGSPDENLLPTEQTVKLSYLAFGSHLNLQLAGDNLTKLFNNLSKKFNDSVISYRDNSEWLIAFDFELSGLFRIKTLLYDPDIYGILVKLDLSKESDSSLIKNLSGLQAELLYKKISDETGVFRCEFTVPKSISTLNLGVLVLNIGNIIVEIYTNGSFFIDLGFPHNKDFSKSWGLTVGIYSGKGGIYFGAFKGDAVNSVPQITNGCFSPVVKIGIGLSIGFERSFDLGIAKGGVSLVAMGILEGVFAVFNPNTENQDKALYYKVSALVGVVGNLFFCIDCKIITIKASAFISAYCQLDIESYREAMIEVYLHFKLSAYIKILFFKISFSFEFKQNAKFYIGSNGSTPWQLKSGSNLLLKYIQPYKFEIQDLDENITISPVITPLISYDNDNYYMAFPAFLQYDDFKNLLNLFLNLLFNKKETISYTDILSFKNIDCNYNFVLDLFANNITINIGFCNIDNHTLQDGFVFPMLPQLSLDVNETHIDYSDNIVSDEYINSIDKYFNNLDPDTWITTNKISDEMLPICAFILTDWVKIILDELSDSIINLFEQNKPQYKVNKSNIIVNKGDTLQKLSQIENNIWNYTCNIYGLVVEYILLDLENYEFDCHSLLTIEQAAALFYIRLYNTNDILYTSYAETLLKKNTNLDMSLKCDYFGQYKITLLDDTQRDLFAGEDIQDVAKMYAILQSQNKNWTDFLKLFKEKNQTNSSKYKLFGKYNLKTNGKTLCDIFTNYYPDFNNNPQNYSLWSSEILLPSIEIPTETKEIKTSTITNLTFDDILQKVFNDDLIYQIGAVVSRAFLQGLRIPDINNTSIQPLYKILNQQIDISIKDYNLKLSCKNKESWINILKDELVLSSDLINSWLPKNDLPENFIINQIETFSEKDICFTVSESLRTNNGTNMQYIAMLPDAASDYSIKYNKPLTFDNNYNFKWTSILSIKLYKHSKGIYKLKGVTAKDADNLIILSNNNITCDLYFLNNDSGSASKGLIPINKQNCNIIRTNLSKETHYISNAITTFEHIADISNANQFIKLLWQCTVIGGGYWLYVENDNISDFVFDSENIGEIIIVISLDDNCIKCANSFYCECEPEGLTLCGDSEKIKYASLPVGYVGYDIERKFDNKNQYQSLFQLLGYSFILDGKSFESRPILPMNNNENDVYMKYRLIFPAYKMLGGSVYNALNKSVKLNLSIRDVLGNINSQSMPIIDVNYKYNDELIALHQITQIKWSYYPYNNSDNKQYIKIISELVTSPDNKNLDKILYLIEQLKCSDIYLLCSFSLCDCQLPSNTLTKIIDYLNNVYSYLVNSSLTQPKLEIDILLNQKNNLQDIIPVNLFLRIFRDKNLVDDDAALCALSNISKNDIFDNYFESVFSDYKLAYDMYDKPIAVSKNIFSNFNKDSFSISSYKINIDNNDLLTPYFYALSPLSNSLITKEINGYKFVNADANKWDKQFFEDIESFLDGDNINKILQKSDNKKLLDRLIKAKSNLAEVLSNRICAIQKDISISQEVISLAKERFKKDLSLAYETGTIACYKAIWKKTNNTIYHLEPQVKETECFSSTKLENNGESAFCLFIKECNLNSFDVSFPYLEYNIQTGLEGYDKSNWLKFYSPIKDNISLVNNIGIPFPKKECPKPPNLIKQTNSTENQKFLKYKWSLDLLAEVYSQDILYINLEYDTVLSKLTVNYTCIDVLANYQLERDSIISDVLGSLEKITSYAEKYIEVSKNNNILRNLTKNKSINIKLGFSFDYDKTNITILNLQDLNKQLLSLGASIEILNIKNTYDNFVDFSIDISSLPVYECGFIKPTAYIVRNSELFSNPNVITNEKFIFHTENISLNPLYISANYDTPFTIKEQDIENTINEIWNLLNPNDFIRLSMNISCEYKVNDNIDIFAKLPIAFLHDIKSKEQIIKTLSSCELPDKFNIIIDTSIYKKSSDELLAHACFIGIIL